MKNCIGLLLLVVLSISCSKEASDGVRTGDEIVVMVYATPPADTVKVAVTDTVLVKLK